MRTDLIPAPIVRWITNCWSRWTVVCIQIYGFTFQTLWLKLPKIILRDHNKCYQLHVWCYVVTKISKFLKNHFAVDFPVKQHTSSLF